MANRSIKARGDKKVKNDFKHDCSTLFMTAHARPYSNVRVLVRSLFLSPRILESEYLQVCVFYIAQYA